MMGPLLSVVAVVGLCYAVAMVIKYVFIFVLWALLLILASKISS